MHSHHSHSGDYVSHATDNLESIVKRAENLGFSHYCLTEHMPRLNDKFLYPEEVDKNYTKANLEDNFQSFVRHAAELQNTYNSKGGMKILLGYEVEGLDESHIQYAKQIMDKNEQLNMSVGSVHYVNGIPIDFSRELWEGARNSTKEKTIRALYGEYFELQYKVITELKPRVIGHFDLIRLFDDPEDVDVTTGKKMKDVSLKEDWPDIWSLVVRNIETVGAYGGLFELNSAAIRKGWDSPYPKIDISNEIKRSAYGRFCLSDDAHSINQVGLNYKKTLDYAKNKLKLDSIYYLDLDGNNTLFVDSIKVDDIDLADFP